MNEAHARVRINSMIEAAGFKTHNYQSSDPSVGYERDVRNAMMRKRLNQAGGVPDYHFYEPNSATPIAFLEAKRPQGVKLDDALKQAADYARIACDSNNPSMLVFASDGIQVRSQHANGSELTLNNYPVDYIPSHTIMRELVVTPTSTQGKAINSVKSIIKLFEDVSDFMRADGIDAGMERLREFCALLFIKIMNERGNTVARENWDRLSSITGQNLMNEYKSIHQSYQDTYGGIFPATQLKNATTLEQIISSLTPINFTNSAIDIKGEAFEYFLAQYNAGKKSELGQHFTPRHITNMMAALLSPQTGEKILDPFCGTGGMLISMYEHVRMGLDPEESGFSDKLDELQNETLYGNDLSGGASSLAKMNMIILGDGQTNIQRADSFDTLEHHVYDKVITNIPFNLKGAIDKQQVLPFVKASGIQITDKNSLCVVKCIESLKRGGAAAIILPLTFCHSPGYKHIRDYIAKKGKIRACIRLPNKTFASYTTAQTAIIIIDDVHVKKTDEFTYIHLKSDGMSQDTKREPIPENDMRELLEYISENRIHGSLDAVRIQYSSGGSFLEFEQMFGTAENVWRLEELITIKNTKSILDPNRYYAEPSLNSQSNLVSINGNLRLGRNINKEKVVASEGDLIIATLHTNNGNGLFGMADREYICTSQIVCTIRDDIVPPEYLIESLRREFPRQLIPTDLVGRENFTKQQILNVLIPKPSPDELTNMFQEQKRLENLRLQIEESQQSFYQILNKIS